MSLRMEATIPPAQGLLLHAGKLAEVLLEGLAPLRQALAILGEELLEELRPDGADDRQDVEAVVDLVDMELAIVPREERLAEWKSAAWRSCSLW